MRAREFVVETFDNTVSYKWMTHNDRNGEAVFKIDDSEYYYSYGKDKEGDLNVAFFMQDQEGLHDEITGSGNAQQVFATVISITRELLGEMPDVKSITFTAAEKNRQQLYARLAKRFLPNWNLDNSDGSFRLTKTQSVTETLNNPYDYRIVKQNDIATEYEFETDDGRKVLVKFHSYGNSRKKGWRIDFQTDERISLTGGGDAFRILATVMSIVREWMSGPQAKSATEINFAANNREPSRVKLYDRLSSMMPQFGFELVDASNYRGGGTTYKSYTFKHPKTQPVTETFNSPVESNWVTFGPETGMAKFTVEGVDYEYLYYTKQKTREGQPLWVWVEFKTAGSKGKYGLTGTGNSYQVLATAVQLTKELLDKYPSITKLIFTAKEKSRQSLYMNMIRRLLPNWEMDTKKEGGKLKFTVTKPFEVQTEMSCQDLDDYQYYGIQAPLAENCSVGATSSGSVATVSQPLGGMNRRDGGTMFSGYQSTDEFPNTPDWIKKFKQQNGNNKRSK